MKENLESKVEHNFSRSYHVVRSIARTFERTLYRRDVVNEPPVKSGPRVFMAPKITSRDTMLIGSAANEKITGIYTAGRDANSDPWAAKFMLTLLQTPGFVAGKFPPLKEIFHYLDAGVPILTYPQLTFQDPVTEVTSFVAGIIQRYERSRKQQVNIIPIGMRYSEKGRERSKLSVIPPFTAFDFPPLWTKAEVEFGQSYTLENSTPQKVTRDVMTEALTLSGVQFTSPLEEIEGLTYARQKGSKNNL